MRCQLPRFAHRYVVAATAVVAFGAVASAQLPVRTPPPLRPVLPPSPEINRPVNPLPPTFDRGFNGTGLIGQTTGIGGTTGTSGTSGTTGAGGGGGISGIGGGGFGGGLGGFGGFGGGIGGGLGGFGGGGFIYRPPGTIGGFGGFGGNLPTKGFGFGGLPPFDPSGIAIIYSHLHSGR